MQLIRLSGLAFLTVLTVSSMAATTASAQPWYHYLGPRQTFTIHLSRGTLPGGPGAPIIECENGGKGTGEVEELTRFSNVVVRFTGCKVEDPKTKERCGIRSSSPKGEKEEIITNTLDGLLGRSDPALLDPAILLYSLRENKLTTLEAAEGTACPNVPETAVKGTVIGLILSAPLNALLLDLHVIFGTIKAILLLNLVLEKQTLEAYGISESWKALALLLFPKDFKIC